MQNYNLHTQATTTLAGWLWSWGHAWWSRSGELVLLSYVTSGVKARCSTSLMLALDQWEWSLHCLALHHSCPTWHSSMIVLVYIWKVRTCQMLCRSCHSYCGEGLCTPGQVQWHCAGATGEENEHLWATGNSFKQNSSLHINGGTWLAKATEHIGWH